MALHPEAQKNAQTEIDSIVGSERLPDFNDRQSLPLVGALCKEVMRYRPVTPLGKRPAFPWNPHLSANCVLVGIPHAATEDTVYKGFFIPAGEQHVASILQF